jgi:hypothetical protein
MEFVFTKQAGGAINILVVGLWNAVAVGVVVWGGKYFKLHEWQWFW